MKKQGFTLVELLGILSILAIITLITVPSVNYIINQGKEKSYNAQVDSVELAVNDYYGENKHILETNSSISITLEDLKNDNYIDFEFRNPKTNKCFSNKSTFLIKLEEGKKSIIIENLIDGEESDCGNFETSPSLILLGSSNSTLNMGEIYFDEGYSAFDSNGNNITSDVSIENNIDSSKKGKYEIIYSIQKDNLRVSRTRTVEVVDTKGPTIKGLDPVMLQLTDTDFDIMEDIEISDNSNEEVTVKTVTNLTVGVAGQYYIDYILTDSSNNVTSKRRKVTVYDSSATTPHTLMQFEYTSNAFVNAEASFRNPLYNDKIATISFTQNKNMPSDKVVSWDLSAEQDDSIMGWLVENEDDNTFYDLYINSKGIIQANPNSSYLFSNLPGTTEINFDNFDTSEMVNMNYIFQESKVTNLDLTSFNTSNVITMEDMFSACHASSINVTSFDTSKVTGMYSMFCNLWNMHTSLDLSSFDTHNVTSMKRMFNNSQGLTAIYASENMVIPTNSSYMFNGCGVSEFTII